MEQADDQEPTKHVFTCQYIVCCNTKYDLSCTIFDVRTYELIIIHCNTFYTYTLSIYILYVCVYHILLMAIDCWPSCNRPRLLVI